MKIIYDSFIYKIIHTVENKTIRKMYEIIRKHVFILDLNFILIFPMWISICRKKKRFRKSCEFSLSKLNLISSAISEESKVTLVAI